MTTSRPPSTSTTNVQRTVRWLLGAGVLLLFALVFNLGLLAYAMYVLLAMLFLTRFLSRVWVENLSAGRTTSQLTCDVGQTVNVVVEVKNDGLLPVVWVLLEDALPRRALMFAEPRLGLEGFHLKLAMLKSRGKTTLIYRLRCNRRGYYQLGPTVLETGDLFGLHRRYRVAAEPHFLMVYPHIVPLEGYDISSKRPIGEVRMSYRLYEDPTRISGVREYVAGDPLNRVHWKATARTGTLHCKVYEPSTVAGATIVMDFHQDSHPANNEPHRSELAVTCAASLAHAVYEMGQQVGLITNGRDAVDRIRQEGWAHDARTRSAALASASMAEENDRLAPLIVDTRRGPEQMMRIRESLARVELTDGLHFPQLILETTSRMPRDATVVAILQQVTTETAVALGNLRRHGFAVTAILNMYEVHDFAEASGPLMAEGIETRLLKDEASIRTICRKHVLQHVS